MQALANEATRKARGMGYDEAAPELAQANQRIAALLRTETDALLDKVLFAASLGMRNSFGRSDG